MKFLNVIIFSLFASIAFGQNNLVLDSGFNPKYIDVTLTNDDKDTVYVLYPTKYGDWYFSETAPTLSNAGLAHRYHRNITGDWYLCIEDTNTSGIQDSTALWAKPIVYDPHDGTYDIIDDDSTFFKFGVCNSYISSIIDYLDPVDDKEYCIPLGGEIWPGDGMAIIIRQKDEDGDGGVNHLFIWNKVGR
jgi:hypothetical protein